MEWLKLKLTFWQSGDKETEDGTADAATYAEFINAWYQRVRGWIEWPLQQFDLENAELFFVDLIAAERKVQRYQGEAESLYRLRVKHAYQNAKDAGSVVGFKAIWQRLSLGEIEIKERMDGLEWDIIFLEMPLENTIGNERLLQLLVNKYGRTCRRYAFASKAETDATIASASMTAQTTVSAANAETDFSNVLIDDNGPLTINGELVEL